MESIQVKGFGHVGIQVTDLARSRQFYRDMLGFEVVWEYENPDYHMLFMGKNGCIVELMYNGKPVGDGQINHLSMLVEDVESARALLLSKGAEFETDILLDKDLYPNGEKFAMFRGPDGERLQLEQIL